MVQQQTKPVVDKVDPVWARICREAEEIVRREPELATFLYSTILHHDTLEGAIVYRLSERLDHPALSGELIRQAYSDALKDTPSIGESFRVDIAATVDRDPATHRLIEPVLYYKGFHAIQTHRLMHWLWRKARRDFALYLQSRASAVFQCDIHPAAKVGRGIFVDHATGLVVGETAVIEDDVSMLHDVTLGGTGKQWEDRHPKIRYGVMIGAGAKISRQYRGRALRAYCRGFRRAQAGAEQRHRRRRSGQGRGRRRLSGARAAHGSNALRRDLIAAAAACYRVPCFRAWMTFLRFVIPL